MAGKINMASYNAGVIDALAALIRAEDGRPAYVAEALAEVGVDIASLDGTRAGRFVDTYNLDAVRTFGPGVRTAGICNHIRKELAEIEAAPSDTTEWCDVILLGLDGAWRSGASPEAIATKIEAKQTTNEGRKWPDWRTVDTTKAIEHDRGDEQGKEGE